MNQNLSIIFLVSVLLNLLFLLLSVWFIFKRGGLNYLAIKIPLLKTLGIRVGAWNQGLLLHPYYHHRKSQFALLSISRSDIVFLGDSITDEGEWSELFNNPAMKNRGISSDTTIGVLSRLDTLVHASPQTIVLMIGVNDLSNLKRSPAEVSRTYKEILTQMRERSPQTSVLVQSVLPIHQNLFLGFTTNSSIRELNHQLQQLAKEFSYPYIDLHSHFIDAHHQLDPKYTSDGIHLNGIAYRHWQALIEPYLLS
ncbi:MAG: hypothetical protein KME42_14295 [Tildeniella nuda ZEHNDER 1965/U140]|jgi:lysophospholipase L1-like esterase|nr:hypothetical protein [Tildeniella nuda ZEHNDER 1965/U140]